ncbi:Putative glycosyl phosphatidyl inositol biosynthesis mannosyltransferase [Komagataella phaffii CBS 7435]|uniref:Mannosyltransferase n=2 Tax=Komagataella phaffii TaxID=460519 RepID=C4R323_KOMPG|nr:Integral membrane protein involved in glycosylphosphatidylinositol (GPI) anchor synthesis [Komagataella phaffii GS115]AOA62252.1 GQ67_01318T0 [Komagataella phaffii]CAH2447542.1 Putative glycosyl phosphatidyl inositol biosynthesis mannosyltransferase [Komagataella phaffii CBS 7435]AOA67355.1 GQ68_00072T0 [Komagataella phaffii GS115]CAY69897.1 Integral membrane protein involved in glycosylphosphatidylinositol (GPI) anchor synthesis [Komagataella phaffii GS115]CCA37735.1 Putative glycosyl phos
MFHGIRIGDFVIFSFLVCFRVWNALSIKTFFQADEYWQTLEPAHWLVFGYGYLTWEWTIQLRSFVYPSLFVPVYWLCDHYDASYWWILNGPKILQGFMCAVGEYYLFKLTQKLFKDVNFAKLVLVLSVLSPFNYYCYTRTFSNSFETVLTVIAMYYWPSELTFLSVNEFNIGQFISALLVAGISCFSRPTSAIIWSYMGSVLLYRSIYSFKLAGIICITAFGCMLVATILNTIMDYFFFNQICFPLYNFVQFNFVKGLASFYGASNWMFYIVQGIPIIMLTNLPFFIVGLATYKTKTTHRNVQILNHLLIMGGIYLLIFSCIVHKEFRFIYPLKPFMLIFTALGVQHSLNSKFERTTKIVIPLLIALSAFLAYYFTQIHESGVIEITELLRNAILTNKSLHNPTSVGFFTPCHSTPFQSHFHLSPKEADIWFLTCEPPLHLSDTVLLAHYRDESDEFYDDFEKFMLENFDPISDYHNKLSQVRNSPENSTGNYPHQWPDYLVIFEHLEATMDTWLADTAYTKWNRLFNSRFHWDHRRTGDLIIYKQNT